MEAFVYLTNKLFLNSCKIHYRTKTVKNTIKLKNKQRILKEHISSPSSANNECHNFKRRDKAEKK